MARTSGVTIAAPTRPVIPQQRAPQRRRPPRPPRRGLWVPVDDWLEAYELSRELSDRDNGR